MRTIGPNTIDGSSGCRSEGERGRARDKERLHFGHCLRHLYAFSPRSHEIPLAHSEDALGEHASLRPPLPRSTQLPPLRRCQGHAFFKSRSLHTRRRRARREDAADKHSSACHLFPPLPLFKDPFKLVKISNAHLGSSDYLRSLFSG